MTTSYPASDKLHIALITLHTPTATNYGGASALPYHLLAFKPKDVEVEVWSFNLNSCDDVRLKDTESTLGIKIHIVKKPMWFGLMKLALVRLLLPKPMLCYLRLPCRVIANIKNYLCKKGSALWIYGEEIAWLASVFNGLKTVVTTPDCEAMYYHRVLAMTGIPQSMKWLIRHSLMYHRYASMSARLPSGENVKYHLVGREDMQFLKKMNPHVNAVFIHHPHYDIASSAHAIASGHEKIRLLIAGRNNFYMEQASESAFEAMMRLPQPVKDRYSITFLGKMWDAWAERLAYAGFAVDMKTYVDDYAGEVTSHHIQLTPVSIGTGTKGKVLDAFANGLMVIGTPLALENIAVESGKECIKYETGKELAAWLEQLSSNPMMINKIAEAGKRAVLNTHGQDIVSRKFFALFD